LRLIEAFFGLTSYYPNLPFSFSSPPRPLSLVFKFWWGIFSPRPLAHRPRPNFGPPVCALHSSIFFSPPLQVPPPPLIFFFLAIAPWDTCRHGGLGVSPWVAPHKTHVKFLSFFQVPRPASDPVGFLPRSHPFPGLFHSRKGSAPFPPRGPSFPCIAPLRLSVGPSFFVPCCTGTRACF